MAHPSSLTARSFHAHVNFSLLFHHSLSLERLARGPKLPAVFLEGFRDCSKRLSHFHWLRSSNCCFPPHLMAGPWRWKLCHCALRGFCPPTQLMFMSLQPLTRPLLNCLVSIQPPHVLSGVGSANTLSVAVLSDWLCFRISFYSVLKEVHRGHWWKCLRSNMQRSCHLSVSNCRENVTLPFRLIWSFVRSSWCWTLPVTLPKNILPRPYYFTPGGHTGLWSRIQAKLSVLFPRWSPLVTCSVPWHRLTC